MLIGLDPLLSPDLLHALAAMGHGDRVAIVDANFPATGLARRLVTVSGASAPAVLAAVLSVLPIDTMSPEPAVVMRMVGSPDAVPAPVAEFATLLAARGHPAPIAAERHAFYRAAADAFVVVHTGERRFYGNILLTKGTVPPPGEEAR